MSVSHDSSSGPLTDSSTAGDILRASLELFSRQGYRATGVKEIADAVGVSVAALYYHFDSKEAILVELMLRDLRWLTARSRTALEEIDDPTDQVRALVRSHVLRDDTGMLLLTLSDNEVRALSPERRNEIVALRDDYEQLWRDVVAKGVKDGTFRCKDAKLATFCLLDMCNGVARWYSPKGALSLDQIAGRFGDFAVDLLCPRIPSPRSTPAVRSQGRSTSTRRTRSTAMS